MDEQIKDNLAAQNIQHSIKELIAKNDIEGLSLLLDKSENKSSLEIIANDLYIDACLSNLTSDTYINNFVLYSCAEELLKSIAQHGPRDELLLEVMALLEESESEYVFTTALRALQILILRLGNTNPRALQWALNSIYTRLKNLQLPDKLSEIYDPKERALLEQDESIQVLLTHYVTVGLFYPPLIQYTLRFVNCKTTLDSYIFCKCTLNQRNVYSCFLIKLVSEPLALLHLSLAPKEPASNCYTVQIISELIDGVVQCQRADLFYLLQLVEERVRWRRVLDSSKGVYELSSLNIFLIEEHLPLQGMAIYYYMLYVECDCLISPKYKIPRIYNPQFIFESTLYLILNLLQSKKPILQERGLLLIQRILQYLTQQKIIVSADVLDAELYKAFCETLSLIISYAPQRGLRKLGVQVLREYIMRFDDEGKYYVLKGMLQNITHSGLKGYLLTMYKDLIAAAVLKCRQSVLPAVFSGEHFRSLLIENACYLPNGIETNLIDNEDQVISSLNFLRFLALNDEYNRTGFWNSLKQIETTFLKPLEQALYFSKSHYKEELKNELNNENTKTRQSLEENEHLKVLSIDVANNSSKVTNLHVELEHKVSILNQHLCTFDLIQSLLVRTTECIYWHNAKTYNRMN